MSTTTGLVKKIHQRGKAFNFVVLENGAEVWYGHGFQPPKFSEGDNITFEWEQKGNFKNVTPNTVQVSSAPATTQQAAPTAARAGGGQNYGNTQIAIQYQASRNSAISLADVMLKAGALPLPTKKGEQYDAILNIVDDLTTQFHVKTDKAVANGGVVLEELEQAIVNNDDF